MSLLRRNSPTSSLAQTAAGSTPPAAPRQSPFGAPRPAPTPPPARPFPPLPSAPAAQFSVIPHGETVMRFQLKGLGDPFHRLLGEPLNLDYAVPQKAADALQKDAVLHQRVVESLDRSWEGYKMVGAMLLSPYDVALNVYTTPLHPVPFPDDDETDATPAPTAPKSELVRAIDLALVLNVLARVRDGILVAHTPLALEPAFLDKVWVTSEARLVALGRATGCLEDVWA